MTCKYLSLTTPSWPPRTWTVRLPRLIPLQLMWKRGSAEATRLSTGAGVFVCFRVGREVCGKDYLMSRKVSRRPLSTSAFICLPPRWPWLGEGSQAASLCAPYRGRSRSLAARTCPARWGGVWRRGRHWRPCSRGQEAAHAWLASGWYFTQ